MNLAGVDHYSHSLIYLSGDWLDVKKSEYQYARQLESDEIALAACRPDSEYGEATTVKLLLHGSQSALRFQLKMQAG